MGLKPILADTGQQRCQVANLLKWQETFSTQQCRHIVQVYTCTAVTSVRGGKILKIDRANNLENNLMNWR